MPNLANHETVVPDMMSEVPGLASDVLTLILADGSESLENVRLSCVCTCCRFIVGGHVFIAANLREIKACICRERCVEKKR